MNLSYRGVPYKRHLSSQGSGYPSPQSREPGTADRARYRGLAYCVDPPTEFAQVPATLVSHKLTYRGVTYFELVHQGIILYVNRKI
ncbi:MAG: hypothetical protein CLLPBCKN_006761 [Chroococcidiopsis cubana SAG 39.79]|uniref:DUF4278 domain-containing protein n=1 Tax=Chroococcidiopsis cubana SAG 39.79 TaxID=388085 RepID=A0AB37U9K1_9CYAN|nr:DUF4278 domain-containing protein [Chroococcidiopsis cubana]MDZ4877326.1 hypothetical protein [Chroococcidiopsis cubana SAG 39.79]PSB61251.1 hypothetical protein C7B79_22665 [Chroococcidiopsis cubana CCALA 043]RUT00680.1 hypothetical protein DSM107010_67320 [Chroococcidiopsis cubana SAG 39.79]